MRIPATPNTAADFAGRYHVQPGYIEITARYDRFFLYEFAKEAAQSRIPIQAELVPDQVGLRIGRIAVDDEKGWELKREYSALLIQPLISQPPDDLERLLL